MASTGTLLSDLPDDLLRRILSFAPAADGAATALLSRRWRWLWRTSGAVNLDGPLYDGHDGSLFLRHAEGALAAARAPVTRLSLRVPGALGPVAAVDVLSLPAARRVQDLRVAAPHYFWLGALPSATLRQLRVAGCPPGPVAVAPAPRGAAFPALAAVRLQGCAVPLSCLQGLSDAAPGLATIHLEGCLLTPLVVAAPRPAMPSEDRCRLRCPAATSLVLADCVWPRRVQGGMELDAPRLRCFRYRGFVRLVSLRSPAPDIHLVDLHFVDEVCQREGRMCDELRVIFWQFVRNFSSAKVLKLKLNFLIEHIGFVIESNKDQSELQSHVFFSNLGRLELEAPHLPMSKGTAMAMATLLHCCPVLRDLQLRLTTTGATRVPAMISFDNNKADVLHEVSDVPGLSEYSFNCVQSCLRTVRLQFHLEDLNCFVVQLARFFAENTLALEEMYIEDPNHGFK